MTIRTRRRGRRSLAAIVAAVLLASLLAVVAGSPAQAANTSSEALVDTNADGVPDAREFGGRDRYDTALRLAENFAAGKGGLGQVPVAFIASGYTLVDAVAVSGLAGFQDAPVLLTPMDNLHGGVADFIEDYGVDTIYVLGGSAAVADSVLEDMEALANAPTVTRIAGADRYATASAIASKLGGGAAWCGGEDAAAILVNGGDSSLAEAMMVGPVAHRLQLPVLMTAADELPSATADFIRADDIEHVIIVGGTDAVSEGVEGALTDAGVNTVERIAGNTPAGTSVALAGLLAGDCKDDLAPVSGDTVALVHRDALPDGVAAAPVLSSTFANGDLVPILVVGDTLPASVRDYLAATPVTDSDGDKVNFRLVAIGGTAAVSSAVMDAALAAAAAAPDLSVAIGNGGVDDENADTDDRVDVNQDTKKDANDAPQVGDDKITLYFSDNIAGDDADTTGVDELEQAIRDILEVNGIPARLQSVVHGVGTNAACDPDTVTVHLSSALRAGDTVGVTAGARLGAGGDQRVVGGTSVTVAAAPVDRTKPTLNVIMIAGETTATITTSEDPAPTVLATGATVEFTRAATGKTVTVSGLGLSFAPALVAGDRITISAGAVVDAAGNKSLQRSFTAIAEQKSPRITSVLMSNLNHSAQAVVAVPTVLTDGAGTADDAADAPDIWVAAKSDGAAAGAAGNGWTLVFDRASSYDADKDLDIDVWVDSGAQTVFVRFNNGEAKFADLRAALEGNAMFNAMFEVKVDADPASITGGACGMPANNDLNISTLVRGVDASNASLAGGETKVAIQVTFNGYISAHDNDELLEDVLAETVERADNAGVMDTDNSGGILDEVREGLVIDTSNLPANVVASYPGTKVTYNATTDSVIFLPQVRDLVVTTAGTTADEDHVAEGYADDDMATTDQDEEENGPSQVRIGRSSSVEAPQ